MAARDRRKGRPSGGFTLLELVVALAVLALIAGSIAVGIRLAVASISRGEAVSRDAARTRATVAIMERAIRSADPVPIPLEDNTALYFVGEPTRLRFVSAQPPASIRGGGPLLVSFFEGTDEDGGLALATASPFRAEGAGRWSGTEAARLLIPGATRVSFTYSEGPTPEGVWEWLPAWDVRETGRLPAAVRVEFAIDTEEGPETTAFVVPIPAGQGGGG